MHRRNPYHRTAQQLAFLLSCSGIATEAGPGWDSVLAPLQQGIAWKQQTYSWDDEQYFSCGYRMQLWQAQMYPWARPMRTNNDVICGILKTYLTEQTAARQYGINYTVVYYGDSLFSSLRWSWPDTTNSAEVFKWYNDKYNGKVFGIGNDATYSAMWRMLVGDLPWGLGTKVIVLNVGQNDMAYYAKTNWQTVGENMQVPAINMVTIAYYLTQMIPGVQVLILGYLPPCGDPGYAQDYLTKYKQPTWLTSTVWAANDYAYNLVQQVNKAEGNNKIQFISCWKWMVNADWTSIVPEFTKDGVHPTGAGWNSIFANCLSPMLQGMVGF